MEENVVQEEGAVQTQESAVQMEGALPEGEQNENAQIGEASESAGAEAASAKKKPNRRAFVGIVTSDKMQKTIVVSVSTRKMDKLYKKYVKRTKKYMAHDEKEEANIGDTVRIVECRPLSRHKRWRLTEIVERAK